MSTTLRIRRLFSFAFGALAMLAVALVSAFITMRLAIHGREVDVPVFGGLTVQDALKRAHSKGLHLNIENKFYSISTPAGRLLSQSPAPGETVRRDSEVRVTESLGSQLVQIPDAVGQSERSATIALRRLSLDLGAVSYLATDGPADTVLAQSPPANATNVDGPRVSLLVSQAADAQAPDAFVMPNLVGVSFAVATYRAAAAGLHVVRTPDPVAAPAADASAGTAAGVAPAVQGTVYANAFDVAQPVGPAAEPAYPSGNVASQYPLAGHRVVKGDAVHLSFAHAAAVVDAGVPSVPASAPPP